MEGMQQEPPSSMSRKRPRELETDSQRIKREKAAERQRRKREKDRRNAVALQQQQQQQQQQEAALAQQKQQQELQAQIALQQQQHLQQQHQQQQAQQQAQQQQAQHQQAQQAGYSDAKEEVELSPEEVARRDKVRAAARERQRKHRLQVKQKRMRELGMDMGNEIVPGMEELHYRVAPDGQYHQVIPPEVQQQLAPPHPPLPHHEPPFPQAAPPGGQTFASTLLLSFSCAPLLKQHLLRSLSMSNEELASLEPVIADAWDRWDHQRRVHYAEHMAKNGAPPGLPPPYGVDMGTHDPNQPPPPPPPHPFPPPHAAVGVPPDPVQQAAADDFRARFHRSIVAPPPFRTNFPPTPAGAAPTIATPSSAGSASTSADVIDPHLASSSSSPSTATTAPAKNETHAPRP